MAKNFFKKHFLNPEVMQRIEQIHWLAILLKDPNLLHLNRRSVSGAFAIGLFIMYVPIPLQMVVAAFIAIYFRANLPIAIVLVWISNPITIPPMFYLAYKVGALLLNTPLQPLHYELSLDWLFVELNTRWQPFLLGCFVMASSCSLIGFVSVRALWRLHLVQRIKSRQLKYTPRNFDDN